MTHRLMDGIDWVGHVDWNVRDFHSYNTYRGATYNAYLVDGGDVALIDTVKGPYAGDLLAKIRAVTDPRRIRYVVCNHAEPDHSSGLPAVMQALPRAIVVCTAKCREIMAGYYDISGWEIREVATGDSLELGTKTLSFVETPMVHWPDSMMTYVPEDRLLFSMDAFGQHYASTQRFDDELPYCSLMQEAKTYYANIVMPYGRRVSQVLKQAAGLDIAMIAPSHGVIWRKHIGAIVDAYTGWAQCRPVRKVLAVYDTMWESTEIMAKAIVAGAASAGVEARMVHLRRTDLTRLATEVLDAAAVAFGSSTLNQQMMPMAGAALTYLKGLRPVGKAAMAFGSYGWGKGGPEAVETELQALKWDLVHPTVKCRYRPTPEVLEVCRKAGEILGAKARELGAENVSDTCYE